jgi:hypothetical protein
MGRALALAAGLLLAGCSDLPLLDPPEDRNPAGFQVELERDLTVEGSQVGVQLTLVDGAGRPVRDLPPWVGASWHTQRSAVARIASSSATAAQIEAVGPGQTDIRVRVAGQDTTFTLRVNPTAVRVETFAYLNQAVQRSDGSLPLVAGRDAVLRVFVTADRTNFFAPGATVRFVREGEEVLTLVAPPLDGIPTTTEEGNLGRTYTLPVPGHVLQPGTGLVVEVETSGVVPLLEEGGTRYPEEGVAPLDIREVAPFRIRFVPVHQPGLLQVGISPGNLAQYMGPTQAVFPLSEVEVQLREPFMASTTTATTEGWSQILHELRVLRAMEGDPIYYHGIVRRIAHWAGLGYVGWPISLTYDALPQAAWTVAHELGHNFGRRHAPCGNPSGVDASFPHPGGASGVHGIDVAELAPRDPALPDLMGYCQPRWISDHNYMAVFNFRDAETVRWSQVGAGTDAPGQDAPGARAAGHEPAEPGGSGLLFWGRLEGGTLLVEPPLPVERSTLPPRPGPWTLVGRDAAGGELFRTPFDMDELSKGPATTAHFTLTLTLDPARIDALARVEVQGPAGEAALEARGGASPAGGTSGGLGMAGAQGTGTPGTPGSPAPAALRSTAPGDPPVTAVRTPRGQAALTPSVPGQTAAQGPANPLVLLSWDAEAEPLVVVRNAATGVILSLARGGRVELPTEADALDLLLTDGIRSRALHLPVQGAGGGIR